MKRSTGYLAIVVWVLAVLAVGTAWAATGSHPFAQEEGALATERIEPGRLVLAPGVSYEQAVVTLVGPNGYRVRREFGAGEPVQVSLLDPDGSPLQNGRYRYTLQVSPRPTELPARQLGVFFVRDGEPISRRSQRAELASVRSGLDRLREQQLGQVPRAVRTADEPRAGRAPGRHPTTGPGIGTNQGMVAPNYVTIDGSPGYSPTVNFAEYGYVQDGTLFQLDGNLIRSAVNDNVDLGDINERVASVANRDYAVTNWREGHFNTDKGLYNYRLALLNYEGAFVNQVYGFYGNYLYAGNPPYYNGLGSYPATPGYTRLVSYGYQYTGPYGPEVDGGLISLWSLSYDPTDEVYSRIGLHVTPIGVGVGTMTPTADISVYDYDFAALRLESYLGRAYWAFSATPLGEFTVNRIGSGGQEFTVREREDAMGPTMEVQGSLQATQFIASSSRELKTDFEDLDAKEVLSKLDALPISSWRYRTEEESVRHFGPVAEDFRAAFQLGDGRHISNVDASGVTMAAIQGLYDVVREGLYDVVREREATLFARLEERDEELASLRREVAELRRLLVP